MKTKVTFCGNEKNGYSANDVLGHYCYGEVKKDIETGLWVIKGKEGKGSFKQLGEAAQAFIEDDPYWVWDGGKACVTFRTINDTAKSDPQYFREALEFCVEHRKSQYLQKHPEEARHLIGKRIDELNKVIETFDKPTFKGLRNRCREGIEFWEEALKES